MLFFFFFLPAISLGLALVWCNHTPCWPRQGFPKLLADSTYSLWTIKLVHTTTRCGNQGFPSAQPCLSHTNSWIESHGQSLCCIASPAFQIEGRSLRVSASQWVILFWVVFVADSQKKKLICQFSFQNIDWLECEQGFPKRAMQAPQATQRGRE